ncbi:hypothetical protein FNH05_18175 [Amycolatopsis rhizosphaerae]|uniref:Uncharacterized protein n=1 Tax=Amycolatopsis rhizosphaerae TaxID=2053003 RepID=A0A558CH46_9PSEU|nr:hypothetical protein FNH05_18175 [Amycolatopsis rhizosphaerae]
MSDSVNTNGQQQLGGLVTRSAFPLSCRTWLYGIKARRRRRRARPVTLAARPVPGAAQAGLPLRSARRAARHNWGAVPGNAADDSAQKTATKSAEQLAGCASPRDPRF